MTLLLDKDHEFVIVSAMCEFSKVMRRVKVPQVDPLFPFNIGARDVGPSGIGFRSHFIICERAEPTSQILG